MRRFPSTLRTIRSCSVTATLYVAIAVPLPSSGQDLNEAGVLNTRVIELYNAGQYVEAIPLAQRALSIRERALGPYHPDLASSLENLATLYATQGQSRSRKSGQGGKWNFCLTAGTLWPANQERPCRDDRAGTTHRPSRRRWRSLPSRAIELLRSLPSSSTFIPTRSRRGRRSSKAALRMYSVLAAAAGQPSLPST